MGQPMRTKRHSELLMRHAELIEAEAQRTAASATRLRALAWEAALEEIGAEPNEIAVHGAE